MENLVKIEEYASTISVAKLLGEDPSNYSWAHLKKYCKENGIKIKKEYHTVAVHPGFRCICLSFPAEAWKNVYNIDLKKIRPKKGIYEQNFL
jgi:hypothetical protein